MTFNVSALITGLQTVATHDASKSTALSGLLVGGLYVAAAAGVTIAPWEYALAGFTGAVVWHFLPPKAQAEVEDIEGKISAAAEEMPTLTPDYSATKPKDNAFNDPPPSHPL
jgi:hypothetical protein